MTKSDLHVLRSLELPDRYENLRQKVGERVAELLVAPADEMLREFRKVADGVTARGEGAFIPMVGHSGAGKSTLANSLTVFLPSSFSTTIPYSGAVDYEAMNEVIRLALENQRADEKRIIPLNFDHRESAPPTAREAAALKRFLRAPSLGSRAMVIWPEVDQTIADGMARGYTQIAGMPTITLPLVVQGPNRDVWQQIVSHTLQLVNDIATIEDLGVAPSAYEPQAFATLGEYMRKISNDFISLRDDLLAATIRPINLVILYASESYNAGVLSQLTSGAKYGLFDSQALIAATPGSVIGRWWSTRRGLLTQTILKLNARGYCLPPATSVAILRAYGPDEVVQDLETLGVTRHPPSRLSEYLSRSDFGKFLGGSSEAASEARGRPAEDARAAIAVLAEKGLTSGRDKALNRALMQGIRGYLEKESISFQFIQCEKQLSFCPLIPDNSIDTGSEIVCIEYAWRSGDFLSSRTRSEVAQYALSKLKNYAQALGWITD